MKNQLFCLAMLFSFLSINLNAQKSDGSNVSLRIAPSVGTLKFGKTFYNDKSIKMNIFLGDKRNLMSIVADLGQAKNPQLGHNDKTINYFNVGLQRCMLKTKQKRIATSSLHVGLTAFASKYYNYKSNCTIGYSGGWGAGWTKACAPTEERKKQVLVGLPINYYLKINSASAIAFTIGCHATLLSNLGHSFSFSVGIELGK